MKMSFYFVLWIAIYPLLALLQNPWINQNSFIVALIVVWLVSWWLNKTIPSTLRYEGAATRARIMEDIYTGNIAAFRRRLSRQSIIEFVTATYFGVTLIFVIFSLIHGSDVNDWIALVIFGLFAYGAITKAFSLNKAKWDVVNNPTPEECSRVAMDTYRLNYEAYRMGREGTSYEAMLPPMPRNYRFFQVVSLIIAIVCSVLGIIYLVLALTAIIRGRFAVGISAGVMYFLYGSLATYFGIRDMISCISFFKNLKK